MNITLFGKGKVGKCVEQLALAKGHQLTDLLKADVAIDFSHPSVVLTHLDLCLNQNIPLIIGTTGWNSQIAEAQKRVSAANGAVVYSPNFSTGVWIYKQLVGFAAKLMAKFPEFDAAGIESHHRSKIDRPSGTAIQLSHVIRERMPHLDTFEFSSVRCGTLQGSYQLLFNSPDDLMTLQHTSMNRECYAKGALLAAQWVIGKNGFFNFDHVLNDLLR